MPSKTATKTAAKKPAAATKTATKASTTKATSTKATATKAPAKAPAKSATVAAKLAAAPVEVAVIEKEAPPPPPKVNSGSGKILSEAQIIAAPEKDYMNDDQLAFFRQRLIELKRDLIENLRDTSEHLRETEATADVSDRATQEEEQAIELRTRDRERKLIKKIDEALLRIDDGSYGFCAETGEPIGVRRLIARPTATLSIEAQERREQKQKMYGE